jgi:hypothetical protein
MTPAMATAISESFLYAWPKRYIGEDVKGTAPALTELTVSWGSQLYKITI